MAELELKPGPLALESLLFTTIGSASQGRVE